jgi:hypothetical protein
MKKIMGAAKNRKNTTYEQTKKVVSSELSRFLDHFL